MENTMYNIILANGTEIHATLNGNNYITENTSGGIIYETAMKEQSSNSESGKG